MLNVESILRELEPVRCITHVFYAIAPESCPLHPSCHNIQLIRLVIWPNGRWWFLYHLLTRNYVNTSRARKTAKIRALWCGDSRSEMPFSVDAMFWWMWVTAITRLRWCTVSRASDITFCVICYCFKLLIAFRFSNLPCLTYLRVGWDQVIIS